MPNIAAHTACIINAPPYISINRNDDGTVTVFVRSIQGEAQQSANQAQITLSSDAWDELLNSCLLESDQ